jgi:hypothetical protein
MWFLAMVLIGISLLAGTFYAAQFGWSLVTTVLRMESDFPPWLEAVSPLKGRWLSLLLSMPLILGLSLIAWVLVAGGLTLVSLAALYLLLVLPPLGLLVLGGFGWLLLWATGVTGRDQSANTQISRGRSGTAGE